MLQGVGARFDFHMCKTLCDLRSVEELEPVELADFFSRRIGEIFDIIVDYPDSKGALQDLKVSSDLVTSGNAIMGCRSGMFAKGGSTITASPGFAKGVRIVQVSSLVR